MSSSQSHGLLRESAIKSIKKSLACIMLACIWWSAAPAGALDTYTWVGGSSSYWSDSANWNPTIPPFPPVSTTTHAVINTAAGADVIINSNSQTGGLTLGGGNSLTITSLRQLVLGPVSVPGSTFALENWGTLQVNHFLYATAETVYLNGGGQIVLWDTGSSFFNVSGTTVINGSEHAITGGGGGALQMTVAPGLINHGTITATLGTLVCNSLINQSATGAMNSSPGNTLQLANRISGGAINPNGGSVILKAPFLTNLKLGGGQFDITAHTNLYGSIGLDSATVLNVPNAKMLILHQAGDGTPCTLTNNGSINLNSSGNLTYLSAVGTATLTGTGRVTLGGNANNYMAGTGNPAFINGAAHTIQGGGTIAATVANYGQIIANNGTLKLNQAVTGAGLVEVKDNATLYAHNTDLQCGNFTMTVLANLNFIYSGRVLDLKGNYTFAQTDPARVNFGTGAATLQLSGQGPWQKLEVGGEDKGATTAGLVNNFALPKLRLGGAGTRVGLVDLIDNGHRTGGNPEVLYVDTLEVLPNTTLNLNGKKLYAYLSGNMHRVMAGEGSLFGGGQIIDTDMGSVPPYPLLLE